MKTITQFYKSNLETVEKALEKSVQAVAKRFGLEIKSWGCNYDSTQSTFKLRATIPGARRHHDLDGAGARADTAGT